VTPMSFVASSPPADHAKATHVRANLVNEL
jgi:hypothetical protein